jgi:SAM-dependent methyltransferase
MLLKNQLIQFAKNVLVRYPKRFLFFFKFLSEFSQFRRGNDHRLSAHFSDIYPCLKDRVSETPFDRHYIYHPAWAARKLAETRPAKHIDISSTLNFSAIASAFVPIQFYDYRPADLKLSNLGSEFADLNGLPFETDSVGSLSCMHTIEHIGLGRYGDKIDVTGDLKAITELKRVLRPAGNLFFVTPVGKPRIEFNAARTYSYDQVVSYFAPLKLVEFSLIPDEGPMMEHADPKVIDHQKYACGCFWFTK